MAIDYPIPGGTLTLAEDHEITERKRRPLKAIGLTLSDNARLVMSGQLDRSKVSPQEMAAALDAQDATLWQYLLSWTLEQPLPASPDGLQDLPEALFDAVTAVVMEHMGKQPGDAKFTVDAVEDPASPTGPSGA